MKFVKMHGCGNDYIYIDGRVENVGDRAEFARMMSDRHKGIGGDGAIFIDSSDTADCKMDMYNADGSRGMMCGNALRCVAALTGANTVETLSGVKRVFAGAKAHNGPNGAKNCITADMGAPVFLENTLPQYPVHLASMGNPHAVMFVDDVENAPVHTLGQEIEKAFEGGINVEFIKVVNESTLDMRVWERGSGETLACGSGACAAAAIAHKLGLTCNVVDVRLLGGTLRIELGDTIYMTGEAVKVFEGEVVW